MAKTLAIQAIISAVDKFSGPMNKMAAKAKSVGTGLSAGLTLPMLAIGAASIKASVDLNSSMANIATLIPGSSDRVEELKDNVQALAVATGKSTEDLAGGLFQVISAFGDSADSAKILEITAKAAAAGLATTTDALNLTSAVTKGYGTVTAEGIQHAADLAFMTNKLGQTTFPELAASIGRVVPLSAELGVSQEDLFGVMATATGVTGEAKRVATQFQGVLQSLLSPTKDMTDLFQALGVESGKALLEQRGLKGTLDTIVQAAKLAGVPLQKFISSIEGQQIALALTGAQSEVFAEKLKAMKDVAGAADQAFIEQTEGINKVGFTMAQLTQKVAVASQKIGDGLAPVLAIVMERLEPVIDAVVVMADKFSKLSPNTQTMIVLFAGLIAAVGPVLVLFGLMVPAITALATPVGAVVAGIFGLIAVAGVLVAAWDPIMQFFRDHWPTILVGAALAVAPLAATVGTLTAVMTALGAVAGVVIAQWEPIKGFFVDLWNTISPVVNALGSIPGLGSVGELLGFGGNAESGVGASASGEAPSRSVPTPVPSPVPGQPDNQVNGAITVKFENTPANAQVENEGSGGFVDLITDVGKSLLPFGVGG